MKISCVRGGKSRSCVRQSLSPEWSVHGANEEKGLASAATRDAQ